MFTDKELDRILEAYIKYMEREYPEGCADPTDIWGTIPPRKRALLDAEDNANHINLAYTTGGETEDYDLDVWFNMADGTFHWEVFDRIDNKLAYEDTWTYSALDVCAMLRENTWSDFIDDLWSQCYTLDVKHGIITE